MSCTPRIQPLPAIETRIAGAPKIAIRSHGSAASAMSPPPAIADDQRHRRGLDHDDDHRAEPERQPGGLHALADRRRPVAGAEEAGRARAVVP